MGIKIPRQMGYRGLFLYVYWQACFCWAAVAAQREESSQNNWQVEKEY